MMSYTAIPPQDRAMKLSCNGYTKRCTIQSDIDSSLKSPPSIQRRVSTSIVQNSTGIRKSAPEHQEIYEGFTFLDEQRRKDTDFCPINCCPRLLESYFSLTDFVNVFKCGHESINPFSFKDSNLERIYYNYFSLVYRSSQLSKFFLLTALFCFVLFIMELIITVVSDSSMISNVRCCIFLALSVLTCLPLAHIHCQRCMRPQHMGYLKMIGLIVCCVLLVGVSPIWGKFVTEAPSLLTVGLWETIWLILLISCFYPVTFYTLLALTIFLCISHSIISILVILLSHHTTFTSSHWAALCGNWMLFIATILLGCTISYLQQKMLRNAFLHAREFLNSCVETKVANEKLDRLLSYIVPHPILPELKQTMLTFDQRDQLLSVVHLRNVSFVDVEICGLSRGVKCDGAGNNNFSTDAVKLMNELFSRFDMLGQELGCYRVRAHPDDYLALAGYPETRVDHAKSCTELAFRIQQTIRQLCESAEIQLEARTVVHTGVTYGAMMGQSRMIFDLLGDDIRVLRYMLAVAIPGKVMVSKLTYDQLSDSYKGDNGPSLDLPLISMSMSSSQGDSNHLETMYLRAKHNKQSSLLTEVNMIISDQPSDKVHDDIEARLARVYPLFTNLAEGNGASVSVDDNGKPTQRSGVYNEKGDGQLSRSARSDSLTSSTNHITKTVALSKLAQAAKFNANIPYYFLSDETFLLSTPDDDRMLLDIGGGYNTTALTGSPIFHGTTKSSVSWKSTLRSQLTQSLIGSYVVDDTDISLKGRSDNDISKSRFTGTFKNTSLELKFQNYSESYMGFALLTCLSTILFVTGVHALLLAKTVMLLLIFLVVFIWIGLALLLILLAKMKCISADVIQSRLSCIVVLLITVLGIFTLFATNSFCCLNDLSGPSNQTRRLPMGTSTPSRVPTTTAIVDQHLKCRLPIYIPLSTVWISLPLIGMMMLPELVKLVVVACTVMCTSIIIFWTHDTMFNQFNAMYRLDGIHIKYVLGIVMQTLFVIIILWMSRILNSFRRLVFQWHVKTEIKRDQFSKLSIAADEAVDILLPKFVSSYFLHPARSYMNLYASEHRCVAVLSVSIPSWCPIGVTEPSDVANNIRVLNQLLMSFDRLIMQPEFEMITKIRTAGESAWYAVGVDCDNPLINPQDRAHAMLCLLRAAEMMKRIVEEQNCKFSDCRFLLRIGIHSGFGFSGVVGGSNPEYGVWGDAYFGATLIQRCGQLDKIHLSSNFMSEIDSALKYSFYDMGTLTFNGVGQLVPLSSGQWTPGTTTIRVFVLREKNTSYSSATSNGVIPFSSEEAMFPLASARRNSLSVMAGMGDHFNPYMMSSATFMPSSKVPSPPLMFPVQPNHKPNPAYCTPPISTMSDRDIPVNGTVIIPPPLNNAPPVMTALEPQINANKCQQEIINRKSLIEGRSKIHHYRNLATELPDSVIPPSPPPHRRAYSDNKNEGHYSPPCIPPRSNHGNNMSVSDCQRVYERSIHKEVAKMTQSAISPAENRRLRPPKSLTPSSSMDSFLELEKECVTNPRTKSSNYSYPPNERLSLIPEAYKHIQDMNRFDDESSRDIDLDKASLDVMATSYNRNFDVDEVDIMSHHNPIYTDNEYESMAESQMNLLDPIVEIRRSRLVNLRTESHCPKTGMNPMISNHNNSAATHACESTFDFPDYQRPSSPNAVANGDDSDHLSKRNRNSSNSRDSSSIAARRSGGATSSDESGQNKQPRKLVYEDSDRNSTYDPTNQCESSGIEGFSIRQQQSLIEDSYKGDSHLPLSMQCTIPTRDTTTDNGNNGSPCTSLVTDMGWTSCDDEDMYSDYPGYASKDNEYGHQNGHLPVKWSDSNDRLISTNHQAEEDESDIDCMRFHSDLISDFSENPLVSDLENETDYEARSSDLGVLSSINEDRVNAFYKFPPNNRFNSDFSGRRGYIIRSENGMDGMYSEEDEASGRRIYASHPWNQVVTGSLPQAMDDSMYTQPPVNHNDDKSSASSNIISKTNTDAKTGSRLPEIAPVRMPNFNSSDIRAGMCRDVVRDTPVLRFVQKHNRYTSSSPERSEYDNVSDKNSLSGNRDGRMIQRDRISHDTSRYNTADDSDAMSGYVGDVASSVYDSDEYEEERGRRFTQLYMDYDVDQGDPMAPFFPRLPSINAEQTQQPTVDNNSNSGSASGIRSDYDNVESDRNSNKAETKIGTTCNEYSGKGSVNEENYQKQIADEARRISLVFRNQWSKDLHPSRDSDLDCNSDQGVLLSKKDTPTKTFVLHSQRETSVESENSSNNCHSYACEYKPMENGPMMAGDKVPKSQSTDCIISPRPHHNDGPIMNGDSKTNHTARDSSNHISSSGNHRNSKDLSKLIQRAERVKNILPSELHQYILPGCISSSSLNSSNDRDSLTDDLKPTKISDMKQKAQRRHFSDEERAVLPM